jgi:hypothetical protein
MKSLLSIQVPLFHSLANLFFASIDATTVHCCLTMQFMGFMGSPGYNG